MIKLLVNCDRFGACVDVELQMAQVVYEMVVLCGDLNWLPAGFHGEFVVLDVNCGVIADLQVIVNRNRGVWMVVIWD